MNTKQTATPRMLWHYTIAGFLTELLESGEIRQATAYVPRGEKTCVWFSSNQDWEATVRKGFVDECGEYFDADRDELHRMNEGPIRIGVAPETAPHDWNAFKRLSNTSLKQARGLYKVAISWGARPSEWFVSFVPVPATEWLTIEIWNGSEWIPITHPGW